MKTTTQFGALCVALLLAACGTPIAPTAMPPTTAAPTAVPRTAVPPPTAAPSTAVPASAVPPTAIPPTTAAAPIAPKPLVVDKSKLAKNLSVYSWSSYYSDDLVNAFEKEFGVRVKIDNYEQNEEMYNKFKAGGNPGYDIIVPSDYMVAKMAGEKLLEKIDFNNVPNIANINPSLRKLNYDPTGEYSIAHVWGTTGIAYDTAKVKRELTSWKDVLEPEKDIQGHIAMLLDPREALSAALRYKGASANTKDAKAIDEAKKLLIAQKKSVKAYQDSPNNAQLLSSGQVWVAQVYVGDAMQIAREKPTIKYIIPKNVTTIFVDNMCIPKGTKAKYTAEVFMNYFLEAKIAAENSNANGFSSPNAAALKTSLIDKDLISNPAVYPDLEKMSQNLELLEQQDEDTETLFDKAWTEIGVK